MQSKNKIKIVILISFSIVFFIKIMISILNKEYIQNVYYEISEFYVLYRYDIRFRKIDLDIMNINLVRNLGFSKCPNIIKIQRVENYIVGYSLGEEDVTSFEKQKYKIKKFCKGYFYINSSDEKDLKFHLTEIEIKKKFGNIEYIKTIDFLNKYGYGSNNQENITDIIIWNFLLAMFFIFSTYILFSFAIFLKNIFKKKNSL